MSVLKDPIFFTADLNGLEGAVGFSAPKVENIPDWSQEEESEDINEMRQRRLKRFSQPATEHNDDMELD